MTAMSSPSSPSPSSSEPLEPSLSSVTPIRWKQMIIAGLVVVILDQITKWLVLRSILLGDSIEVIPGFFNLVLTFNKGAAFGMMAGLSDGVREVVLALTTGFALVVVAFFLFTDCKRDALGQVALAMILGGALGNIIDRIRIGAVIDFLDVYYGTAHWPAFNVADSAICIGVALLILRRRPHPEQRSNAA